MSKEGMQRFAAYLKSHPDMTEIQKRRVISAFLDKFALEEEIEEESGSRRLDRRSNGRHDGRL